MLKKVLSTISQNEKLRPVFRFARDLGALLLIIFAALLATGVEISFVYANF